MTTARLLPFFFALLAAGPAFASTSCPQFFPGGQAPALLNPKLAQRGTLLCNDAYASFASGVTHGALWSAEHPTRASLQAAHDVPREGAFHPDDRLPVADQAQLQDYRRSGYDRGHMTPSGDMPDEAAQQQSFSLANMVPQTPDLNRGVWSRIETGVRRLAERRGELFVVTGAAFVGTQIASIGPDGVLVPSSTWKAIFDPVEGGTGVYVCSNTSAPHCAVVSVATLEREVGIDPFPALPAAIKAQAMALPEPGADRHHGRGKTDNAAE